MTVRYLLGLSNRIFSHRGLTAYLLSHGWQALCITFLLGMLYILPGGSLPASFAIIFAVFITLVKGPKDGLLYTIAATVPLLIYFMFGLNYLTATVFNTIGIFSNVFAFVAAFMVYRKTSLSQIIQVLALMGMFAVAVIHLVFPDVVAWWAKEILDSMNQLNLTLSQLDFGKYLVTPTDPAIIKMVAQTATGFIVAAIVLIGALTLVVGRMWQCKFFGIKDLRQELENVRLGQLAGILFMLSTVVLYFYGNSVILDLMPVLTLLFALAGLSLVHYIYSHIQYSPSLLFVMILLYVGLALFPVFFGKILALLAFFDVWLDVRKQYKKV